MERSTYFVITFLKQVGIYLNQVTRQQDHTKIEEEILGKVALTNAGATKHQMLILSPCVGVEPKYAQA